MIFLSGFSKGFDLEMWTHIWSGGSLPFLLTETREWELGRARSNPITLIGGTPQGTKLTPQLFCILVNKMASNYKYVIEFVPRLSPSYLNFTFSDIFTFAFSRGMVLNGKKGNEMCISFLQYCPFPPHPVLVGNSRQGVYLSDDLTWNEHVTHIVKKGSKRLYALRALKKCGLSDNQLILVFCSIIRSV